ncbi:MAG TPA: glycosyltransferase family 39 protein [Terriglobales bacterium]|nr:glycosyltransferase family 39 protein [Terriglobales bacterium]
MPTNRPAWVVRSRAHDFVAIVLLAFMGVLAGGAALTESLTFDEMAHIGAGLSYWQKFDLRFNEEHPPLAKLLASLPLVLRGTRTDYSSPAWTESTGFFDAYMGQWVFGEYVLNRWNNPVQVLAWSRAPMLLLALALGWCIYVCGARIGGGWGGLLALACYASAPVFLSIAPLVHTDIAITLFSLLSLWSFASVWREPTRRNTALLAISLTGALLSKFSAVLVFFAFVAVAVSTRWRSIPGQPTDKAATRAWRRTRWRATLKATLWAMMLVYAVYFVFSWHQPSDSLSFLGNGHVSLVLRRLFMPPWLYLRGMALVAMTGNRPAFLLGHTHPHGVWYYFPVLLLLKSPLGFLGLPVLTALAAWRWKTFGQNAAPVIPAESQIHWRVLWVSLLVFSGICILSHLNVSFRHFSVPLVLLMLMIAPLPALLQRFRGNSPKLAAAAAALTVIFLLNCIPDAVRQYPNYFPFVSAFAFGRPAYTLMSDSNVDWNQSLPEVRRFAEQHAINKLKIDEYGWTFTSAVVPNSELWDCQQPADEDAGQWVVVSANVLVDMHNCAWLLRYPHQAIAEGSMYAVQLPKPLPVAGTPGGPPLPADTRIMFGFTFEPRIMFQKLVEDPASIDNVVQEMAARFQEQAKKKSQK